MTPWQAVRASLIGFGAALAMFPYVMFTVDFLGLSTVNQPPSAALADVVGLPAQPTGLLVHFAYAIFWALVFLRIFGTRATIGHGLAFGGGLWLLQMLVYAPVIGYGFFGFGGPNHGLPAAEPLHIGSGWWYMAESAVLHAFYGAFVGWLIPDWAAVSDTAGDGRPGSAEKGTTVGA